MAKTVCGGTPVIKYAMNERLGNPSGVCARLIKRALPLLPTSDRVGFIRGLPSLARVIFTLIAAQLG